jgi:hypothetical protein
MTKTTLYYIGISISLLATAVVPTLLMPLTLGVAFFFAYKVITAPTQR